MIIAPGGHLEFCPPQAQNGYDGNEPLNMLPKNTKVLLGRFPEQRKPTSK